MFRVQSEKYFYEYYTYHKQSNIKYVADCYHLFIGYAIFEKIKAY